MPTLETRTHPRLRRATAPSSLTVRRACRLAGFSLADAQKPRGQQSAGQTRLGSSPPGPLSLAGQDADRPPLDPSGPSVADGDPAIFQDHGNLADALRVGEHFL